MEIFPYKYYKESYFPLSQQFNVQHRWTQNNRPTSWSRMILNLISQERCMESLRCRSYARADNVALNENQEAAILKTIEEIEVSLMQ